MWIIIRLALWYFGGSRSIGTMKEGSRFYRWIAVVDGRRVATSFHRGFPSCEAAIKDARRLFPEWLGWRLVGGRR